MKYILVSPSFGLVLAYSCGFSPLEGLPPLTLPFSVLSLLLLSTLLLPLPHHHRLSSPSSLHSLSLMFPLHHIVDSSLACNSDVTLPKVCIITEIRPGTIFRVAISMGLYLQKIVPKVAIALSQMLRCFLRYRRCTTPISFRIVCRSRWYRGHLRRRCSGDWEPP